MAKTYFTIRIDKEIYNEFKKECDVQGRLYNLSIEEAMKLWLAEQDQNQKNKQQEKKK